MAADAIFEGGRGRSYGSDFTGAGGRAGAQEFERGRGGYGSPGGGDWERGHRGGGGDWDRAYGSGGYAGARGSHGEEWSRSRGTPDYGRWDWTRGDRWGRGPDEGMRRSGGFGAGYAGESWRDDDWDRPGWRGEYGRGGIGARLLGPRIRRGVVLVRR